VRVEGRPDAARVVPQDVREPPAQGLHDRTSTAR
jgi:hypothetical protein